MEDDWKKLVKFNAKRDEDFDLWRTQLEAHLESRGVMEVVSTNCVGVTTDKEMVEKKMVTARSIIIQALGDKPLRTVMAEKKNPFVMWNKLCDRYATATATKRVKLQTRLHQMHFTGSKSMSEFVDEMEAIFNRLESMQCEVQETMKVAILLSSFGDKGTSPYGPVVSALETLSDDKLTWDSATSRLLQEYDSKQNNSNALSVTRAAGQKRYVTALKAKANVMCYGCGKKGHYVRDCYSRKSGNEKDASANVANVCTKSKVHFAMVGATSGSGKTIIDSGASAHMVGGKHMLRGPFQHVTRRVVLGDGRSVVSRSSGCAVISCKNQNGVTKSVSLSDVLSVPSLDTNLISCAELDRAGHTLTFKGGECHLKLSDEESELVLGTRRDGVYELNGTLIRNEMYRAAHAVGKTDAEAIWHNRLGHVGLSTVQDTIRKGSVKGLALEVKAGSSSRCEWCLEGKQTRLSLRERSNEATRAGDIIHSDVCGPMPVSSTSGKRYFVTFIDAWSHFKYVSLLARKSEVLQKFKESKAMFERKFDCTVKNVYSDNGGEYEGMVNYLNIKSIGVNRAAPYTPEQNGVAERTNRTVLDMARSMLSHAGMSAQFWGEAVTTATDIRNHIGIRKSSMLTPIAHRKETLCWGFSHIRLSDYGTRA